MIVCDTCRGERVLETRENDGRGGETEGVMPCPDCGDREAWSEHRERMRPGRSFANWRR